jgi:hypothetical protein
MAGKEISDRGEQFVPVPRPMPPDTLEPIGRTLPVSWKGAYVTRNGRYVWEAW